MAQLAQEALQPLLESATKNATKVWQEDLKHLFLDDIDRNVFPVRRDGRGLPRSVWGQTDTTGLTQVSDLCELPDNLIFLLQRKQCSVVQITVPDGSRPPAVFLAHRYILTSRSPYLSAEISENPESIIILPESAFTPQSFRFILGYLYTGTLMSTQHEYDLLTAFEIYRGSVYLQIPSLGELILAKIMVEMLHGLYYAQLSNNLYSQLVGSEWGAVVKSGCRCRTCACRVPHVLQFALEPDIKNDILERGARRAMLGLFGEGWCTEDFSILPNKIFNSILADIRKFISPSNVVPLLFEAETALQFNQSMTWVSRLRERIVTVREIIDNFLCANAQMCFESEVWRNLMKDTDGEDISLRRKKDQQVAWVMEAISGGISHQNAYAVHQALLNFGIGLNPRRGFSTLAGTPINKEMHLEIPERNQSDTKSLNNSFGSQSSASSFYSCISSASSAVSLKETSEAIDSAYLAALSQATSLCSLASSRTISTDYGIYYTRWALSQETIQDQPKKTAPVRRPVLNKDSSPPFVPEKSQPPIWPFAKPFAPHIGSFPTISAIRRVRSRPVPFTLATPIMPVQVEIHREIFTHRDAF